MSTLADQPDLIVDSIVHVTTHVRDLYNLSLVNKTFAAKVRPILHVKNGERLLASVRQDMVQEIVCDWSEYSEHLFASIHQKW
jgi:hypothetical protein